MLLKEILREHPEFFRVCPGERVQKNSSNNVDTNIKEKK
jgi:hypothetical protein